MCQFTVKEQPSEEFPVENDFIRIFDEIRFQWPVKFCTDFLFDGFKFTSLKTNHVVEHWFAEIRTCQFLPQSACCFKDSIRQAAGVTLSSAFA